MEITFISSIGKFTLQEQDVLFDNLSSIGNTIPICIESNVGIDNAVSYSEISSSMGRD